MNMNDRGMYTHLLIIQSRGMEDLMLIFVILLNRQMVLIIDR